MSESRLNMFSCSPMSESNCCECWDKFDSANFVQTFEMSWISAIWALVLCEYVKRPVRNAFTSCRSSISNFLNKGFVDSLKLEFVIKRIIVFLYFV